MRISDWSSVVCSSDLIRFKLLLIDCKIAVFAEADLPALAVGRLGIGKRRPRPAKQAPRIIAGKRSGYSPACGQADKMVTRAERPRHLLDQAMGNDGRTGSRCVRSRSEQRRAGKGRVRKGKPRG